jgi:serine/threonine protein phosphatase PrpC
LGKKRVNRPPLVECGVASRTRPGEEVCGDLHVVRVFPNGTLVAVVDGLGAGDEAAVAAKSAVAILKRYAREPVTSLVKRCDRNLMMTRGAAITLASFSAAAPRMSWLGVGNVEGLLLRANPAARPARERLRLRDGVVGYHLPIVQESSLALEPGDTLILASDGIRSDFDRELDRQKPPQAMADDILAKSFKGTDDALVLVARYLGRNHEHDGG